LFPRLAAAELRRGDAMRPRAVQPLLSRHAEGRRLSRSVGLRGGLRLRRARLRGDRGNARGSARGLQVRKIVARPRKMKKPPESVQAVMSTEEPTAGSRPKNERTQGMETPISAASRRLSSMAS